MGVRNNNNYDDHMGVRKKNNHDSHMGVRKKNITLLLLFCLLQDRQMPAILEGTETTFERYVCAR